MARKLKNLRFRIEGRGIVITPDAEMQYLTVNMARGNSDNEDEIGSLQALTLLELAASGNTTSRLWKNVDFLIVKGKLYRKLKSPTN